MVARPLHRLRTVLALVLLLGTIAGQPAMVLGSLGRAPMAGQGHHHGGHHPAQPANSCCDFCWTTCATAPGAPRGLELAYREVVLGVLPLPPVATGWQPVPIPPTLPFSQGPPALLV